METSESNAAGSSASDTGLKSSIISGPGNTKTTVIKENAQTAQEHQILTNYLLVQYHNTNRTKTYLHIISSLPIGSEFNKPQSSKPWNLALHNSSTRDHVLDMVKWTPTSASKIKPKFLIVMLDPRPPRPTL
jgi:hypothetical protein